MKHIALLLLAVTTLTLSSCQIKKNVKDETVKTYQLNLKDFKSIKNQSNCDIFFTQSDTYSVVLKAPQSWKDSHKIYVQDGSLVIGAASQNSLTNNDETIIIPSSDNSDATLTISAPSLGNVNLLGNGDFVTNSDLTGEDLEISLRGNGDILLKGVKLDGSFRLTALGNGDFNFKNLQANDVSYAVTGNGDVDGNLSRVAQTSAQIIGNGDVELSFDHCGTANVGITGNGDVKLSGQLQQYNNESTGTGDFDVSQLKVGH